MVALGTVGERVWAVRPAGTRGSRCPRSAGGPPCAAARWSACRAAASRRTANGPTAAGSPPPSSRRQPRSSRRSPTRSTSWPSPSTTTSARTPPARCRSGCSTPSGSPTPPGRCGRPRRSLTVSARSCSTPWRRPVPNPLSWSTIAAVANSPECSDHPTASRHSPRCSPRTGSRRRSASRSSAAPVSARSATSRPNRRHPQRRHRRRRQCRRRAAARDRQSRRAAAEEGATEEGRPEEGRHRRRPSRRRPPRRKPSQEGRSRRRPCPKKAAPKKAVPKKAVPKKAVAQEGHQEVDCEEGNSEESNSEEGQSEEEEVDTVTAPGHFEIYSSARPRCRPVTTRRPVTSTMSAAPPAGADGDIPVDSTDFRLHVDAPRYVMPPDQILSTFPPAGSEGDWRERLPQIVLKRRTLPWERNPKPGRSPADRAAVAGPRRSRRGRRDAQPGRRRVAVRVVRRRPRRRMPMWQRESTWR